MSWDLLTLDLGVPFPYKICQCSLKFILSLKYFLIPTLFSSFQSPVNHHTSIDGHVCWTAIVGYHLSFADQGKQNSALRFRILLVPFSVYIYVCMCIFTYKYVYICMYVYMYIYVCVYMYVYTVYTHTSIYAAISDGKR
jgi:hypothetical protein